LSSLTIQIRGVAANSLGRSKQRFKPGVPPKPFLFSTRFSEWTCVPSLEPLVPADSRIDAPPYAASGLKKRVRLGAVAWG